MDSPSARYQLRLLTNPLSNLVLAPSNDQMYAHEEPGGWRGLVRISHAQLQAARRIPIAELWFRASGGMSGMHRRLNGIHR